MSDEQERIAELERELADHVGFLEVLDNAGVKFNGMSPSEALAKLREIAGPSTAVPTRADLERALAAARERIAELNGDKRRLQDLIAQLHGLGLTADDTAPQVAVEREEVEGG